MGKRTEELSKVNKALLNEIEQHKQTEEALLKAGEQILLESKKWQIIFDGMNDAVFLLDMEGVILQANEASFRFFEKSGNEILGKLCYKIVHNIDSPCEGCPYIKMKLSKQRETMILPIADKWFEITVDPMLDNEGQMTGAVHIICDITWRKLAEQAAKESEEKLRESEKLFHHLFSASPDAIMLLDSTDPLGGWPIVNCNEIACTMNGYKREELIGKSIDILNISVGTPEERAEYLESLHRKSISRLETFHRHRDGHIFPIEVSTSIIKVGEHELILGIDRDITDRKQAEEALIKSEKNLQEKVTELSLLSNWLFRSDHARRFGQTVPL